MMPNENVKTAIWSAVALLAAASVISFLLAQYQINQIGSNNHSSSGGFQSSIPQFPDFQPVIHSGSISLYRNFVMTVPITPENIVKYSYRIQAKGKLATGKLIVQASATDRGYDSTRIHSVYFYIDDGRTGGHIDSTRNTAGQITSGGFTNKGSPYNAAFDLNAVPVSYGVGDSKTIRALNTLNDNQPHAIGAFVSTGVFGSLDLLEIQYACEANTDCSIDLVK